MPFPTGRLLGSLTLSLCVLLMPLGPARASEDRVFTAAEIDAAEYAGGGLPSGRSPLTAKVQLLLDRSGTSPGVIDGFKGGMSRSAIMAFERRAGLPVDGELDPHVWNLLQGYAERPVTQSYTITEADAQGLVDSIPTDFAEKALMDSMGYTSVAERLAERFHMDERFIQMLNPGIAFVPGNTIKVMAPNPPIRGQATRILIDKENRRVAAFNAQGKMLVDYPATIGSAATPSPVGNHNIRNVAINPNYTYNPAVNFQQGDNDRKLVIPPGPNGPVGTVWIGLTKPTYGIHGTPTPSQLFRNQSMGCVRLTNWDAEELARLVSIGGTTVEFLPTGVTIADAIGAVPVQTPPAEPLSLPANAQPVDAVSQPNAPTETPADEPGDSPPDALSDALAEVLPEGFVMPLPETEQP